MSVTLTTVDPVLRISDICALLKISETTFRALKQQGWFAQHCPLIEIQPPIDSCPRYSGEPFAKWLDSKHQQALWRKELREVHA